MGFLVFWVVMAVVCALVANSKGRSGFGFLLYGFLIWPVALVHALVMTPNRQVVEAVAIAKGDERKCPHCAELIKSEAKVCKHCGRDVAPALAGYVAPKITCASCGTANPTERSFCVSCGAPVSQ